MRRKSKTTGTASRIEKRTSMQPTDYDRTKPPSESDEQNEYRTGKRRAVRYMFTKVSWGYRAEVVGPFFSKLYAVCGYGTTKGRAKVALERYLASDYGFIGTMLLSTIDEANTIGLSAAEKWHRANNVERESLRNADVRPITSLACVGTAGQ